jgi:diacylglycerol kinase family enzyme
VGGHAIIFNPSKTSKEKLEQLITQAQLNHVSLFPSDSKTNGYQTALKVISEGHQNIAIAGGDGTIRAVIQAVAEAQHEVSIGLIAIGTGNVLARNLRIPLGLSIKSLERALSGQPYRIDLGEAMALMQDGHLKQFFFTGIAGLGMDARIMQRTRKSLKRRVGWIAYIDGGFRSLPLKFEKFEVSVDERPLRTLKSYSILVGNAGWLPGNISMMPDAKLDDGQLDFAAIGPRRIWNWMDFLARVTWQNQIVRPISLGRKFLDATANLKTMENLNGARIRIRPSSPSPMQLDGDVMGEVLEVNFCLKPKGLVVRL